MKEIAVRSGSAVLLCFAAASAYTYELSIPVVIKAGPTSETNPASSREGFKIKMSPGEDAVILTTSWNGPVAYYALYEYYPPNPPVWNAYFWPASYTEYPGAYIIQCFKLVPVSQTGGDVAQIDFMVNGQVVGCAPADFRNDEQIANAPKISIGAPGGEDGFMKFGLFGNGLRIAASGRISDPGHAINPNGLELQVDENGVRRTVNVPVGPDGSFHIDGLVAWGPNGPSGRPLVLYHRTAGDEVNVGYFGNGTEVSRKKELKTFGYDALRNKISEAVKAEPGRFRHIRTNGVTLGVRG